MQWFAQAPANIALIKYMGKQDKENNIPDNPSLSYTLPNLLSNVMLENQNSQEDYWEPLAIPGGEPFHLSTAAQERFLRHLTRIKNHFNYSGGFLVQSVNNFPQGTGLASSASSFAALTKCAVRAISDLKNLPIPPLDEITQLSRLGSGSSCRSFFSPWALWDKDQVQGIELPYNQLQHQIILISHSEKKVSSSEAHERIKTSEHYAMRSTRAKKNLKDLLKALQNQDWKTAYTVCWKEFQDMHELFRTCDKPFSYMTPKTLKVLEILQKQWQQLKDGPLITMDAGPNIHLLYRPDQSEIARIFKQDYLIGNYDVL
jgi:diphosphomevalonate decarboxylase